MRYEGVEVENIRFADHTIPVGVQPDMTAEGENRVDWPHLFKKIIKNRNLKK